jgi:hypothetical protein
LHRPPCGSSLYEIFGLWKLGPRRVFWEQQRLGQSFYQNLSGIFLLRSPPSRRRQKSQIDSLVCSNPGTVPSLCAELGSQAADIQQKSLKLTEGSNKELGIC